MSNIRTSSRGFSCYSFAEFYLLESVHFHLHNDSMLVPPERHFLPSTQYLVKRLAEYQEEFNEHFARTLRDYLWFAAMGEARHSQRFTGTWSSTFDYFVGGERHHVYCELAPSFPPTKNNVEWLYDLFTRIIWNGAFGGQAWGRIVRAIQLYDELTPSAFIDHCADLQHNGGVAFDKSVPFWNTDGYSCLMSFLNFKFKAKSLVYDLPAIWNSEQCNHRVSSEAVYLMNKLFAVVGKSPWADRTARWNSSSWNYNMHSGGNYTDGDEISHHMYYVSCTECGHEIGDYIDSVYWDDDCDPYCNRCYFTCSICYEYSLGEEKLSPNNDSMCRYCFHNKCDVCVECRSVQWLRDLNADGLCEDCVGLCHGCGHEYPTSYLNADGLCEDCVDLCECGETASKEMYNLDKFDHDTYLSETREFYCEGCIKKLLDARWEIWYTDNQGLVLAEDMSKLMEYPYEELLDIHLTKQFTHMSMHAGQGGLYG